MDPKQKGQETENRFFAAFTAAKGKKLNLPSWFIGVVPASPSLDMRGIDAVARITVPRDTDEVSVPIQIKSSASGKREYLSKHPAHKRAEVPILVITGRMSAHDIRNNLLAELKKVRRRKEPQFDSFFKRIFARKVSKRGREIKRIIRKRRKRF